MTAKLTDYPRSRIDWYTHRADFNLVRGKMPVNTPALIPFTTRSQARLSIHAESASARITENPLERLHSLCSVGQQHNERAPLNLKIEDLQGCVWFDRNNVGPLVDVSLPAGTYHVTANLGNLRRGYTLTLEQGAMFDLYLRFAADRQ
jgi:hypothetical protein